MITAWDKISIRKIKYEEYLYVCFVSGVECDEVLKNVHFEIVHGDFFSDVNVFYFFIP